MTVMLRITYNNSSDNSAQNQWEIKKRWWKIDTEHILEGWANLEDSAGYLCNECYNEEKPSHKEATTSILKLYPIT